MNQLRDIHEPANIGLFPFALGWWTLIGLLILILLVIFSIKKIENNPRRLRKINAVKKFLDIKSQYKMNQDQQILIENLSKLLRKITLSYSEGSSSANLIGIEWLKSLDMLSAHHMFVSGNGQIFSGDQYRKKLQIDNDDLLVSFELWVSNLQ